MCHDVCSNIVQKRPNMVGTVINLIQIDEARFAEKREYKLFVFLLYKWVLEAILLFLIYLIICSILNL